MGSGMIKQIMTFLSENGADNLVTIVLGIFAAVGWVVVLADRIRHRKRSVRISVYQESLSKIDELHAKISRDFTSDFLSEMPSFYQSILESKGDAVGPLSSFLKHTYERMTSLVESINISFSELNKLRLVASPRTLSLLDKYRALSIQQANQFSTVLDSFKRGQITGGAVVDQNMQISDSAKKLSTEIASARQKLEKQMRADIGFTK